MLFEELDTMKKNFLDVRDIYDFLKNNSASVAYARAERVLRRLDGDLDGIISFDDWITGLLPENRDPNSLSNRNSKKSLQDTRVSEISCSLTDSNLQKLALGNIEKLKMMESQKSLQNLQSKLGVSDKNLQEAKDLRYASFSKESAAFAVQAPEATYKKNNPPTVYGVRKNDVDNQMTNRGKQNSEAESHKDFEHMKIQKF